MAEFRVMFYHHAEPEFEYSGETVEADDATHAEEVFWDQYSWSYPNIELDRVEEL